MELTASEVFQFFRSAVATYVTIGMRNTYPGITADELAHLSDADTLALVLFGLVPIAPPHAPIPPGEVASQQQNRYFQAHWLFRVLRGMTPEIAAHEAWIQAKRAPTLMFTGVDDAPLPARCAKQRQVYLRFRRNRRSRGDSGPCDRDDALVEASRKHYTDVQQLELPI